MSAGASPQTPLRELTALPRSPSWFQGDVSRQEGMEERGGEKRTRRRGRREGKGKGDREGGKGRRWGIAPWSLGDRRPSLQ